MPALDLWLVMRPCAWQPRLVSFASEYVDGLRTAMPGHNGNRDERQRCLQSNLFRPIRREEHLCRAFDHLRDAFGRGGWCGLKDERQKQRGLAHLHELRRRKLAVVDR